MCDGRPPPGDGGVPAKRRAGVLCFREVAELDAGAEFLVVSRRSRPHAGDADAEPGHDRYTMPAGKFEEALDSSCEDCAQREALEEAGVECQIVEDLGWYASSSKLGEPIQTRYFLGRCVRLLDRWLEDGSRGRLWMPPPEALRAVSYRQDLAAVVDRGIQALDAARLDGRLAASPSAAVPGQGASASPLDSAGEAQAAEDAGGERFVSYSHQCGGHFRMVKPAPGTRLEVELPSRPRREVAGRPQAFARSSACSGDSCFVSGSRVVLKPFDAHEEQFYCHSLLDEDLSPLLPFVPLFYGTKKLNREQVEDLAFNGADATDTAPGHGASPGVDPADRESKYAAQHVRRYLVLEDLGGSASQPCFLDLKVGCRQRSARHNTQKRAHMAAKAAQSTSAALGFRVCGMQGFDRVTGQVQRHDKYWGQRVTVESMSRTLAMFFSLGLDRPRGSLAGVSASLVMAVVKKLERLESLLRQLPGKRFWGSSVLIFFDAGVAEEVSRESCLRSVQVKIIDFANFQDVGGEMPDQEYLCGIANVRMFLEALLRDQSPGGPLAGSLVPPPAAEVQDLEQERARERLKQATSAPAKEGSPVGVGTDDETNLAANAQTISGATGRTLLREIAPRHLVRPGSQSGGSFEGLFESLE